MRDQHLRRTDSGSSPDIGGTEWTEAPALNRNTFNAKTSESVKGRRITRGAWTTCNVFSIYAYIQPYSGIFEPLLPTWQTGGGKREKTRTVGSTAEEERGKKKKRRKQDKLYAETTAITGR